uniref:Uncharacterized protein n=1 Tax=Oryza brachyantha TaxID=4533 RepID=J3N5N3_ORYBR
METVVKARLAMEEVERILAIVPRAPVPVPEYKRYDDPVIDELHEALTSAWCPFHEPQHDDILEELRTKGYVDACLPTS